MSEEPSDFDHLTVDAALDEVEYALDRNCTNICRPLNSYINRVYEIITEDGDAVIAKFYRPGRWTREALQDEHDFLLELHDAEIPVIPPLRDEDGHTLHELDNMFYAVFPKMGGRICDEPTTDQWLELGRLMGRTHVVGSQKEAEHRITQAPEESTYDQLQSILASGFLAREHQDRYEDITHSMLDLIEPLFDDHEFIRIHGDLHHQNLIYRPGESFFLIDFDDMAMGVAVQDMWMLLPGRLEDARPEVEWFIEGYETFRTFDRSSLRLIEALRAMRYIHFTAWCIHQAADGGFSRLAPDWGTSGFWRQEIHELEKQQQEIWDTLEG